MLLILAALAAFAEPMPGVEPPIVDVEFAPLLRSERGYRALGPVGPYYPDDAARAGVNGAAVLECVAGREGALEKCKVLAEKPEGRAFGAASRVLATRDRIRAPGPPPEGQVVRVRVPFVLGVPAAVDERRRR